MSESVYLVTIILFIGTVLTVFAMKYFASVYGARSEGAGRDAYRLLASKAVVAQGENAAALEGLRAGVSEVAARLAAVEKMLREVE